MGIILQPKRDKVIVTREVYNFSEFLNDFGAWAQAMIFIATALIPLFRISTIEGFLIHKLYKTIAQQPHHASSANLKDEIDFAKQTSDGWVGIINAKGDLVVKPKLASATRYSVFVDGLAPAYEKEGETGFLDRDGHWNQRPQEVTPRDGGEHSRTAPRIAPPALQCRHAATP